MSKRSAFTQLTKDLADDDRSTGRPDDIADPPKKATAAQMAARKIRQAKPRARPGGGSASPQMSNPLSTGAFGSPGTNLFSIGGSSTNGNQQQQTPIFSFAQQPQTQTQQQQQPQSSIFNLGASQSFPPMNGTSSPQPSPSASFGGFGGFGGGGFNFGGAAQSSGGFTFSASGSASNPFASANAGASVTPPTNAAGGGGFSGSPFNIPPAQTESQQPTNFFSAPSANTQSSTPNLFGAQNSTVLQQGQSTNVFGQALQPAAKTQSFFASNLESMQTSPDTSPEKPGIQSTAPFSFGGHTAAAASPTKQQAPASSNLFTSLANPPLTSNPPATMPDTQASPSAKSSTAFPSQFAPSTISALTQIPPQSPQLSQLSSNTSEAPRPNAFAAIAKPSAAPASTTTTANPIGRPFAPIVKSAPPVNANQPAPSNIFGSTTNVQFVSTSQTVNGSTGFSVKGLSSKTVDSSVAAPAVNPLNHLTAAQKQQFREAAAVKALNIGLRKHLASINSNADWRNVIHYYLDRRAQLSTTNSAQNGVSEARSGSVPKSSFSLFGNAASKPMPTAPDSTSSVNLFGAAHSRPFPNGTLSPSKPDNSFAAGNKRKADEELSGNDLSSNKKSKGDETVSYPTLPSSEPRKQVSQTSSLFQSILDGSARANSAEQSTPTTDGRTSIISNAPAANQTAFNPFTGFNMASPSKPLSSGPESSQQGQVNESSSQKPASSTFVFQPSAVAGSSTPSASSPFQFKPPASSAPDQAPANPFKFNPSTTSSPAFQPSITGASTAPSSTSLQFKPPASDASTVAAASPFKFNSSTTSSTAFPPSTTDTSTAPPLTSFQFKPPASGASTEAAASTFKFNQSSGDASDGTAPSSGFKPPNFGGSGPVNFLAQFGKKAEEDEKKEKAERKAKEFDSEEEDEAEWERKDAEERAAKKAKIAEVNKGQVTKFVPGKGFVVEPDETNASTTSQESAPSGGLQVPTPKPATTPSGQFSISRTASPAPSTTGGSSVFDTPHLRAQNAVSSTNIFAHLSDADSGAEGSRTGDADDEESSGGEGDGQSEENKGSDHPRPDSSVRNNESEGETLEDAMQRSRRSQNGQQSSTDSGEATPGRSLFDRIKTGADGKPEREEVAEEPKQAETLFKFGMPADTSKLAAQATSTPKAGIFASLSSPGGDHTWKQDSPIKFAGSTTAHIFSFTAATPNKPAETAEEEEEDATPAQKPFGNLFHTSVASTTTPASGGNKDRPFGNLFGTNAASTTTPGSGDNKDRPFGNLFGSPKTVSSTLAASKPADVGFTFGAPPKSAASSLFPPSAAASVASSRATSPGLTTDGGESTAEGADESDAPPSIQVDLTALTEEERAHEEILYEVAKAKCMQPDSSGKWESRGVGPIRILKNKDTGVTRLLMRIAPSGSILVNTRLLGDMSYQLLEGRDKIMQFAVPAEGGKVIGTLVQVGRAEDAEALVKVCEENKPKKE